MNKSNYREAIKIYKTEIKAAKALYYEEKITLAANCPREIFRIAKSLLTPPVPLTTFTDIPNRCNEMAEFFSNKIQAIYNSFPQVTAPYISLLPDETAREGDHLLDVIPPLDLPSFQGLLSQLKSGAPSDVAPPNILNLISETVSPVALNVINASLVTGIVPSQWKQAMVRALLKKTNSDPEVLSNYRPISLLPGIGKLAEKHVNRTLSSFLEDNSRLHPSQNGFRPQHGTETALLIAVEELRKILDGGGCAALILLDLSAAFDTVNHQLLIQRLRRIGVTGIALKWLQSFLEDRSFVVFEEGITSKQMPLRCGVPQGSSLSPTLFNIYMSLLADIVTPFGIQIVTYADDTQLVVALNQQENTGSKLALCLEKVSSWMDESYLKLNGAKTELMLLGNSTLLSIDSFWPSCLGTPPSPKPLIKSLGVWLDQKLDFKEQAGKVAACCFGILRMLRKILPLLPSSARKLLVQALILSRLDYANALYLGAPLTTIKKLQIVQNCAARLLLNTPKRLSAKPALASLHWLPIQERVQFKALCIMHKAFSGKGPPTIRGIIQPYHPKRSLRSDNKQLAVVPKIKRTRSGGRRFSFNAAKLWNHLPTVIRLQSNHSIFRKQLKTYLFP